MAVCRIHPPPTANSRLLAVLGGGLRLSPVHKVPLAVAPPKCTSSFLGTSRGMHRTFFSCSSVLGRRHGSFTRVSHHSLHTSSCVLSSRRGHWSSIEDAQEFLAGLPIPQRECLERAVLDTKEMEERQDDIVTPPTWKQLKLLGYHHALPFIGFGFLDNFIMITVGEYIDINVGAALSISTMAAAGIGNLISDLAGLGLADRVEVLCKLLGLPDPKLTPAQLQHRSSRWMGLLGRCLGITVGCIIGMAPLLLFKNSHKADKDADKE